MTADSRHLAIFDLDDTLLDGDCTGLWIAWLVRRRWVEDGEAFMEQVARHDQQYHAGTLDMQAHLRFVLAPLIGRQRETVRNEVMTFIEAWIRPRLMPGALERLAWHRAQGHDTVIISASMHHLVAPIADVVGADEALATHPAFDAEGCFTGEPSGIVTYQAGKLKALEAWLAERKAAHRPDVLWGYSDSHNDLPLLEHVDHAHVIQPDARLARAAERRGWPRFDWRAASSSTTKGAKTASS
ncbi:HAD superfamily hydrolase (TIGR01490 family) [Chromohalobacter marismortui]|uniref:HAD superfamily hydrolase (TIGR01490 family) n=1 Tax=Chromohalobacter marismortui TaxID=42055 RepID=A0A4R7NLM0_9GAMM|nr:MULTISPECIES: HAD-IB family hydrolase [Chromohalobacter]MCI0510247.1 HAD-IB family hydrolase [Chromohalobacter sp.]MCI0593423.1 HAD-IB family hydrolase [Chromohalobacter sp.]TDU21665.1 HAD superfamily hydrolase (TIGR01490 family) [Chromohalobacter marismortui]